MNAEAFWDWIRSSTPEVIQQSILQYVTHEYEEDSAG